MVDEVTEKSPEQMRAGRGTRSWVVEPATMRGAAAVDPLQVRWAVIFRATISRTDRIAIRLIADSVRKQEEGRGRGALLPRANPVSAPPH